MAAAAAAVEPAGTAAPVVGQHSSVCLHGPQKAAFCMAVTTASVLRAIGHYTKNLKVVTGSSGLVGRSSQSPPLEKYSTLKMIEAMPPPMIAA